MKKLIVLATLTLLASCATATIPDNIPPGPPPRKGEPILAPSAESAAPAADGFGGDGFGGETPTTEAEAAEPSEADGDEKPADPDDETAPDGAEKPAADSAPESADAPD